MFSFRLEWEDEGGSSVKEKLSRKIEMKKVLEDLNPTNFLETVMTWKQGKNVFIEEDCIVLNFGFVVNICVQQNRHLT